MPRSSKDIAKRLRFDHRPRRDAFRRLYLPVGLAACAAAAGLWIGFGRTAGPRQYSPGPLSPAHATFGDRCEHCHVSFASTPNDKCLACHSPRVHSKFEVAAPACADCHVEHRAPDLFLAVSDHTCVACHTAVHSTREPPIAAHIASLADHPELTPLRPGQRDPTALRFNHQLHLTSKDVREPAGERKPLTCESCHGIAADGRYMQPIRFATHCQRCHALQVKEAPAPIGEIEAPHDKPELVRQGLTDALLVLGAQRPKELFAAEQEIFIPGQVPRGALDDSKSIQEFQRKWLARLESELYRPFVDHAPLLDNNKYCFLCHVAGAAPGPAGLPTIEPSTPPARWLQRAEFSHRKHDELPCRTCHPDVEHSTLTSETNLPSVRVCQQCHIDAQPQSAGTRCTLCHLYHDTSKHPELRAKDRPMLTLEHVLGTN
jgi:hypothetical protein